MSQPHGYPPHQPDPRHPAPRPYPPPSAHPQPAYPQPAYPPPSAPSPHGYQQAPPGWAHQPRWVGQQQPVQPGGHEPMFSVRLIKHTGILVMYHHQPYTVTGTLAQCKAEIGKAQLHNLLFGWWGVFSGLVFNWIALSTNLAAYLKLRRAARDAGAGQPSGRWHA